MANQSGFRAVQLLKRSSDSYGIKAMLLQQAPPIVSGSGQGGGHGCLEGHCGIVSDNIVQLKVILGNGSAIHANETNRGDLLWGMKGADHNVGIVTSAEVKTYPSDLILGTTRHTPSVVTSSTLSSLPESAGTWKAAL